MPKPAVKLSELREIGWEFWDPMGIRDLVSDDYAVGPADEYDRYLMVAFGMAQSGRSAAEISAYLGGVSSEHMGLGDPLDGGEKECETARKLIELSQALT